MPASRFPNLLALPLLTALFACYLTGDPGTGLSTGPGTTDSTAAAAVVAVSGDNQTGPINTALPDPLVVRVTTAEGDSLESVVVVWTVTQGGGALSLDSSSTDVTGLAQVTLTLGPGGINRVRATVSGTSLSVDFTATATVGGVASGDNP
jgi:hypothetical protein